MFTASVPEYTIHLEESEGQRWAEIIAAESVCARLLVEEAVAQLQAIPELLRWVFARLYQMSGGLYRGEIQAWADALHVSAGTATILNCAYELSHLRLPKLFGCTAGIRWIDGMGLVHVRSLDWPLSRIGDATRVFRFRQGQREFVVVGVPGHVGALSGMLPHAYSVTINWAPPAATPSFQFGPAFLLRHVLETCDKYETAVRMLTQTPLSTSVFYTVCGVERDEACVIERTQRRAVVRPMTPAGLVQANHHVAPAFARHNDDLRVIEEGEVGAFHDDSIARMDVLGRALAQTAGLCSLE